VRRAFGGAGRDIAGGYTCENTCNHTCSVILVFYGVLYCHYYLSLLCKVFTVIYLTQTMFLGYIVLQLFSIYSLCYM